MESSNNCKLCSLNETKYVCPRCNIPYCSLPCYQSQAHSQCSESFYKDCVVQEMKNDDLNPESTKKMMDILQRVQQVDEQFEDEELIDSDDDSDAEELAARLAGVDLDDADSVWNQLTDQEKRRFEELLCSGDVSEVIPQWQPWWCYKKKKKIVEIEELNSESQSESQSDEKLCPPIQDNIQPLSKITNVVPSPSVRWNMTNVLAAYAATARVYNGDHHSAATEAAATLLALSTNLANNQIFDNPESAVVAVQLAAVNENCIVGGLDENLLKEDVQSLVEGPLESRQEQYVLAALSDIHMILTAAKQKAKENKNSAAQGEFSKRFPISANSVVLSTSPAKINKCLKKIEFYLSWAKEFF